MPPKKIPPTQPSQPFHLDPDNISHADLVAKLTEMAAARASMNNKFDRLEKLWTDTREENRQLKSALQEKDREISNIRERMNEQEQYTRSWCVRVLNMKLPEEDSTNPCKVMQHVYKRLLLPILEGALQKKLIQHIPSIDQLLETAHILPCKPGTIPPPSSPGSSPGPSGP
jgi:hypothetical protein